MCIREYVYTCMNVYGFMYHMHMYLCMFIHRRGVRIALAASKRKRRATEVAFVLRWLRQSDYGQPPKWRSCYAGYVKVSAKRHESVKRVKSVKLSAKNGGGEICAAITCPKCVTVANLHRSGWKDAVHKSMYFTTLFEHAMHNIYARL